MSDELPPIAHSIRQRLPLVWLVPIIAILAAGWLAYRTISARGPMIEITLQSAEGIEARKTKVKHRDIDLGLVENVAPSGDLTKVIIQVRMNRYAEKHLRQGTRFWVMRPRLSAEGISGLGTLISGSYIEMEPGPGEPARSFVALEDPPVVNADVPGTNFTLHTSRVGSISQGAPVSFHGIRVGEVLGYELSDDDGSATVQIFVRSPHDKLVHVGTRFWNAGGITVALNSEGVKVQTESLQAILAGGIAFDVPRGGEAGPLAKASTVFTLFGDADAAHDAMFTRKIPFMLHLTSSAQGLSPGAAVLMRGIRVGEVTDVHLEYDAATGQLSVPVTLELEPQRTMLLHTDLSDQGFTDRAYNSFRNFVARGLRARLVSSNLFTGQKAISLDFARNPAPAALIEGGAFPELPAIDSDDIDSIMQASKQLLASLDSTVTLLHQMIGSPEVRKSIAALQGTLVNLEHLTADSATEIGPLLREVRAAARSADQTLNQATSAIKVAGAALDGNGEQGGDLAGTLNELKQAARSLHLLADYLESHPDALLRGKNAGARP